MCLRGARMVRGAARRALLPHGCRGAALRQGGKVSGRQSFGFLNAMVRFFRSISAASGGSLVESMLRGEFVVSGKRGGHKCNPCGVNRRAVGGSGFKGSIGARSGNFTGHVPA